jgi:hypothetical protein
MQIILMNGFNIFAQSTSHDGTLPLGTFARSPDLAVYGHRSGTVLHLQ